jgi:hypothetical protein
MKIVYTILSVAGWAWCVVVLVCLVVSLRRKKQHGFEVVEQHEE